jgi:outer membrane protein OmpA-like peptidoglycan-associated protein
MDLGRDQALQEDRMRPLLFVSTSLALTALALVGCQAEVTTGAPQAPTATVPPPPKKLMFKRRKLILAGKAEVAGDQIKIPGAIQFETAKSTIRESDSVTAEILNTVYEVLTKNPQLTKLAIEGHTDNEGPKAYNQKLSDGRAAAVVKWLVAKGIGEERLESKGYGMEKPLAANDSAANKQLNRRVEFHMLEVDGKPFAPAAAEGDGETEATAPPAP